ncbi:MAG TPA: hypothetical protein VK031_06620 [Tissierellaceae bacterium]|nr:hypothetical protein [Tissierellaceae bacterium]
MNNDRHIAYQFKEGKFLYRTPEQVEKAIDNKESWYHKGEYVLVNSRGYIFDSSSIKVFKKANKALKFSNDTVYITVEGKKLTKGVSVRSYSGELSARYREGQFLRVVRKGYYKRYLWGWGVDNKEEIMEAVEHYQDYPEVIYMGVDDNQLKYTPLEELAKWLLDNKRGVFQDADIPKSSKQAIMRDLGYSSEE